MSASEIVIITLTALALLFGIVKVWIQSKTDIAKIQVEIVQIKKEQKEHEDDLVVHKRENDKMFDKIHSENREDHQIMFRKIDSIINRLK